jgi:hypothetical protein
VEGCREHGNEPSGSLKVGTFVSSRATGGFSRRKLVNVIVQTLHQMLLKVDEVKKDEIGGTCCNTNGRKEKCFIRNFGWNA